MRDDLSVDWDSILAGKTTQEAFDELQERITKAVKLHVPEKTIDDAKKNWTQQTKTCCSLLPNRKEVSVVNSCRFLDVLRRKSGFPDQMNVGRENKLRDWKLAARRLARSRVETALHGSRRTDIAPPGGSHNQDISSLAIFTINTSSLEAPKPSVTEIWPAGATGAEDLEGSRRTEIAPHNRDILLLGHIHNKHFVSLASQQSTVDIPPYGGSQDILLLGHVHESHFASAEGSGPTEIAPPGHNQDISSLGIFAINTLVQYVQ
ncbi:hypothetical protein Bbelb_187310 [Branchiostoma belcheri]|nr:hypothetical protein Bbelb_187310 [Branchiostoma belcheri]